MTHLRKSLLIFFLGSTALLIAQESTGPEASHRRLAAAFQLANEGHPADAIAAARSLMDAHILTPADQARALDLEGMCYQDIDDPEKAIRALEAAQQLVEPENAKDRASILDNLGQVYSGRGDTSAAARLYGQAFGIYEAAANHGGMARVMNNQAGVALMERHRHEARKFLDRAYREAKQATDLDNDDFAAIASMQGWLAQEEGDTGAAIDKYQQALQLWRARHGEQHPSVGWGLLLLGRAETLAGECEPGQEDMRKGLALMGATVGPNSQRYLAAEMAYAQVLKQSGETAQAMRLEMDAKTRMIAVTKQSCEGCTVSVLALR